MSTISTAGSTVTDSITIAGTTYQVTHPRSAEELIDEADYARDERLPYWADLWPSAHVLALELAQRDLRGRRVLELGCGVGLPAIVAARGGARVLATDWYDDALRFATANAEANGATIETLTVDWRQPPPALMAAGPFDLVVAADVLYEQRNGVALAPLIGSLAHPGLEVLIADPRRPHADELLNRLTPPAWEQRCRTVAHRARRDESGPLVHLHHLLATPALTTGARSATMAEPDDPR